MKISEFPKLIVAAPDGAQAEVYLHGAQITAWRPAGDLERLFLSKKAIFQKGVAIRGGVPVCFPQFGAEGPSIKHGFARLSAWELVRIEQTDTTAQAMLQITDSAATQALWPYTFQATLTVSVGGARLLVELAVQNTGKEPFTFTAALHTYLRVKNITRTTVENLGGKHYRDAVTGAQDVVQVEPAIHFNGEINRLYGQTMPIKVILREPERALAVSANGFPDIVLWNPWAEGCAKLKDMEPDDYRHMVCVEAAVVSTPPVVLPGATWRGTQELVAE